MSSSKVKWLQGILDSLQQKGELSEDIASHILAFAQSKEQSTKANKSTLIFSSIGVLLLGLSIIVIIAHNWSGFSPIQKSLCGIIPLLIAQAGAVYVLWFKNESTAIMEGAAIAVSVMVGAALGAVGQAYHSGASIADFLTGWVVLIVFVPYIFRSAGSGLFYLALCLFLIMNSTSMYRFESIQYNILLPLLMSPFIYIKVKEDKNSSMAAAMVLMIFFTTTLGMLTQLGFAGKTAVSVFIPVTVAAMLTASTEKYAGSWQKAAANVGDFFLIVLFSIYTNKFAWRTYVTNSNTDIIFSPAAIIAYLLFIFSLYLLFRAVKTGNKRAMLAFPAMPVALGLYLAINSEVISWYIASAAMSLFVLAYSIAHIYIGGKTHDRWFINKGLIALLCLIAAKFFDPRLDFITKSIAFLIVGAGMIWFNIAQSRRAKK